MDHSLLTLRHIEVFRAVMLTGSVTGAAGMLHSSQPTISRELARMEQLAGLPLFDRQRGRLQPTRQALALFEEVQRAYHGMERIRHTLGEIQRGRGEQVAILCQPGLAQSFLPDACRRWLASGVDASIRIASQDQPLLGEWLAAQRYDLGVREVDGMSIAGVEESVVFAGQEVCVLPLDHPLACLKALSPRDLHEQPFICLDDADPLRHRIDAAFEAAGARYRPAVEARSSAAVCALVAQGLGVAVVNPLMAWAWRGERLCVRRFVPEIGYSVVVGIPRHLPASRHVLALAAALREAGEALSNEIAAALEA